MQGSRFRAEESKQKWRLDEVFNRQELLSASSDSNPVRGLQLRSIFTNLFRAISGVQLRIYRFPRIWLRLPAVRLIFVWTCADIYISPAKP
jgi:hypothetical protein